MFKKERDITSMARELKEKGEVNWVGDNYTATITYSPVEDEVREAEGRKELYLLLNEDHLSIPLGVIYIITEFNSSEDVGEVLVQNKEVIAKALRSAKGNIRQDLFQYNMELYKLLLYVNNAVGGESKERAKRKIEVIGEHFDEVEISGQDFRKMIEIKYLLTELSELKAEQIRKVIDDMEEFIDVTGITIPYEKHSLQEKRKKRLREQSSKIGTGDVKLLELKSLYNKLMG